MTLRTPTFQNFAIKAMAPYSLDRQVTMRHRIGEASVTFTFGAEVSSIVLKQRGTHVCLQANPTTTRRERVVSSSRQTECPVCRCDPEDPFSLDCGHTYCKQCFVDQCIQHGPTQEIPIRCLAGLGTSAPCDEPLHPHDMERGLSLKMLGSILEASFRQYVRARPAQFRFCPSPRCSHLNHIGPVLSDRNETTCDRCFVPFCLKCDSPAHRDSTCEQANGSLETWKRENGAKDCPKCGTTTIKDYGCNHMQCPACMIHFCWFCLASFSSSGETYGHMTEAHDGDWGVEQPHEAPIPPDFLVRAAERLRIGVEELQDNFEWALEQQPEVEDDNESEVQSEASDESNDSDRLDIEDPSEEEHSAFYDDLQELSDFAEARFNNTRDNILGFLHEIARFIERHPRAAIDGFVDDVDRLQAIEVFLGTYHVEDVGARLRTALDHLYWEGLYEALFELAVEEERQVQAQVVGAPLQILIAFGVIPHLRREAAVPAAVHGD